MNRLVLTAVIALAAGPARAEPPKQLTVAIYSPSVGFADSSARLAYAQGLARAIQGETGVPTTAKAFVRLSDLTASKPDFAVLDGLCVAARGGGKVLATAVIGGGAARSWGLYASGEQTIASLRGKRLAFVRAGCRDTDFIDNAMLDSEIKSGTYFSAAVAKMDVGATVAAVRDYKEAEAVFAPAEAARGLSRVFEGGSVPNPGFVALNPGLDAAVVDQARKAVLGHAGSVIEKWTAPADYGALGKRLDPQRKRPLFASPQPVRLERVDILVLPTAKPVLAPVKDSFWQPPKVRP